MHPREIVLDFNSLKLPFLCSFVIQSGYWPYFSLESFFMKHLYLSETLTDFRKTVETVLWHDSSLGRDKLLVLCLSGVASRFRPSLITSY